MKNAKDVMTQEPVCCRESTPLLEVSRMMCDYDCGEIPVIDDANRPVGVVTDRDIVCRAIARQKNPLKLEARECMTSPCITVNTRTSLEECCWLLESHQIRRLPVVDEQGRCCGIVSQADIALNAPAQKTAELLKEVSKSSV